MLPGRWLPALVLGLAVVPVSPCRAADGDQSLIRKPGDLVVGLLRRTAHFNLGERLRLLPGDLVRGQASDAEVADITFRATLRRRPTDEQKDRVIRFLRTEPNRETACKDVIWALVNSREFVKVQRFDDLVELMAFSNRLTGAWQK